MATTDEQKKQVLEYISSGLSIKDSCQLTGIGEKTYYDIVNRDAQFSQDAQKARLKCKLSHIKNIKTAGNNQWQASAWWLERMYKTEFGKIELTKELSGDDIEKMDEDELDAYLNELESKLNGPSNEEEES